MTEPVSCPTCGDTATSLYAALICSARDELEAEDRDRGVVFRSTD